MSKGGKEKLGEPKTAAKSTEMVPQPHGGALLPGGVPGNAGGTGAPPSALRLTLRKSFSDRVKILEQIADGTLGEKVRPSDRAKAIDILAKYGLGPAKGHDEALFGALARDVEDVLGPGPQFAEIRRRWVLTIGAHVRGDAK